MVWRTIPTFPCYVINEDGHILSLITDRLMKQRPNHKGYMEVRLTISIGKSKLCRVHRLVLEAFVGPCPPDHEGAHINGIRAENKLSNLAWKTPTANQADRLEHGTSNRGTQNGRYKHGAYTGTNSKGYGV